MTIRNIFRKFVALIPALAIFVANASAAGPVKTVILGGKPTQ